MARKTNTANAARAEPFHLVGGRLALDFANTADWADGIGSGKESGPRGDTIDREHLQSPADLERWVHAAGLTGLAGITDDDALAGIRGFREHVRNILLSALDDRPADEAARHAVGAALEDAGAGTPLARAAATSRADGTVALKAALAVSALALLIDRHEIDRVKMCEGSDCGWLFVDESRGRNRRWCRMETCGNRAKARRHYRARSGT